MAWRGVSWGQVFLCKESFLRSVKNLTIAPSSGFVVNNPIQKMKISIVFNGPFTQAPLTSNLRWWWVKKKGLDLYGHQLECRNTSNGSIIKMTITLVTEEGEDFLLEKVDIIAFARLFIRPQKVTEKTETKKRIKTTTIHIID